MNRVPRIKLGQPIEIDGVPHTPTRHSEGVYRLRNNFTGQHTDFTLAALSAATLDAETPAELDLTVLENPVDPETELLGRHIEEVCSGTPLGTHPRPQYSTELPFEQRLQAKLVELEELGTPIGKSTFLRKRARYLKMGVAGLVDGRSVRSTGLLKNADPRVIETLAHVMAAERDTSTGTISRLRVKLTERLTTNYPGEHIKTPSDTTLWRYIQTLDNGKFTLGSASNRRSAHNVPKRVLRGKPAIMPGHEVQIDSTRLDLLVRDDNGDPRRLVMTIMVDKATRSIIGTAFQLDGAKAYDHSLLLARTLVPRNRRPHRSYDSLQLPDMPWTKELSSEERQQFETRRPFIVPQRIITDLGRDYAGTVFRSACAYLGIDLTEAAVHTPTDKGIVERTFGSMKTMLIQHMPGYTGGAVEHRGRTPEREDLLDMFTAIEVIDEWVDIVWQNTPREGLRDPRHPGIIHTPNSMYTAMYDLTGYHPIWLSSDDYIELMPFVERTIGVTGITVERRRYDSPELLPLRQATDTNGKPLKWRVRYDPYNPDQVWVKHPTTTRWIACAWMNADELAHPLADIVRERGIQALLHHPTLNSHQAHSLAAEITRSLQEQEKNTKRSAMRAALAQQSRDPAPIKIPATSKNIRLAADDYIDLGDLEYGDN